MAGGSRSACCRSVRPPPGRGPSAAGIVVVLLVVFLLPALMREVFRVDFDPVGRVFGDLLPRAIRLVLMLAGHGGGGEAIFDD